MAAYGLDISQILEWTFPQLLLTNRRRKQRERHERRFSLMLMAGSLPPEMFDQLWQGLGGAPIDLDAVKEAAPASAAAPAAQPTVIGKQAHAVDRKGNVMASGAPLLSDIALGKAVAPPLIPITKIDKSEEKKESDG